MEKNTSSVSAPHIALELVPKSLDGLLAEAKSALEYPAITQINIPEIKSVDIKSFEATMHLLEHGIDAIPHFRTIDRDVETMEKMLTQLVEKGLKQVLFISGDIPNDLNFIPSNVTPIDMVRELKPKFPELKFYGALDPYRTSIKEELDYCHQKLEAGYDGLFTQAFFSGHLLEAYLEYLKGVEIYIGISPVTTASSQRYWENINKVVFTEDFEVGLQYHAPLSLKLLEIAEKYGQPSYLMPITISSEKYLKSLWEK